MISMLNQLLKINYLGKLKLSFTDKTIKNEGITLVEKRRVISKVAKLVEI